MRDYNETTWTATNAPKVNKKSTAASYGTEGSVYQQYLNSQSKEQSFSAKLLGVDGANSFFVADAVSCCKKENTTTSFHGVCFIKFMVDFWDENSRETEAVFQVEIHAPSDWSLDCFVDALGYTIKIRPCNTTLRRSTSVDAECTVQGQTPSSMGELFFSLVPGM